MGPYRVVTATVCRRFVSQHRVVIIGVKNRVWEGKGGDKKNDETIFGGSTPLTAACLDGTTKNDLTISLLLCRMEDPLSRPSHFGFRNSDCQRRPHCRFFFNERCLG